MNNEWSFRDEILSVTHRWHQVILFCLVGALLGGLVSLAWPSPHRATKELYVGLNIFKADLDSAATAGLQFTNVDDFKNWQMASLNSLIYMDSITQETLERLRLQDAYWAGVTREQLTGMLHAYWRNAGKWRLVAESDDPQRAVQAVMAWHDVVVERVHTAVGYSHDLLALDKQLQAVATCQAQALTRLAELNQAATTQEDEKQSLQAQVTVMEAENARLVSQYAQGVRDSLGLSASLEVEPIRHQAELSVVRPTGSLLLIGSCLGLFLWAAWMLVLLTRNAPKNDQVS